MVLTVTALNMASSSHWTGPEVKARTERNINNIEVVRINNSPRESFSFTDLLRTFSHNYAEASYI